MAKLLVMDELDPRLDESDRLLWSELTSADRGSDQLLFLGFAEHAPRFVRALPRGQRPAAARSPALMEMMGRFSQADSALYAAARSLLYWHAHNGFCGVCGVQTVIMHAGWGRRCDACATEHFPRVEPVVIMLAELGDRVLLGRQPSWPPGRYSALAGFLEVGESVEAAVAREIAEESGVRVRDVRYVASQPWPFPASLMLACIGTAESGEIRIDPHELEDARWFSLDDVQRALWGDPDAPFIAPPAYAIAHSLLTAWVAERTENHSGRSRACG